MQRNEVSKICPCWLRVQLLLESLNVFLNMARAALIREREFRLEPQRVHRDKSRRVARRTDPPDIGGQKCAQKIAANLNC